MQDPREIQELMQKGLKELQSMKVRREVIGDEGYDCASGSLP